jgi:hypothetical protein
MSWKPTSTLAFVADPSLADHILGSFADIFQQLRKMMREQDDAIRLIELTLSDLTTSPVNYDALITVGDAGLRREATVRQIKGAGAKIFSFWDDLDHLNNQQWRAMRHRMFQRCDYILLPYYRQFFGYEEYRPYWNKAVYFPWFAPDRCLTLGTPFESRLEKILLSGAINTYYPLRSEIAKYASRVTIVDVLAHPSYDRKNRSHRIIGDSFYNCLAKYKAAIATSLTLEYTVAKYIEIPANGCLMLGEPTDDLSNLGFVDEHNFLAINGGNYRDRIKSLFHCSDIEKIAAAGRELIRKRHTTSVRMREMLEIIVDRL